MAFDESTDPNEVLGRPGKYISKADFEDIRLEQDSEYLVGGTIETFEKASDCTNRYEYLKELQNSSLGAFALKQYIYKYDKVIFRLEYSLTPSQAEEYHTVIDKIMSKYQDISSQKSDTSNQSVSQTEAEPETTARKQEKHDFDPKTNKQASIRGFTFSIPSTWMESKIDDNNIYYYPEDGTLLVQYTKLDTGLTDNTKDAYISAFEDTLDNYACHSTEDITIGETSGFINKISFTISDMDYDGYLMAISDSEGLLSFFFGIDSSSEYTYDDDFEAVKNSIQYEPAAKEIPVPETSVPESNAPETQQEAAAEETQPVNQVTQGQKNALSKAKSYLNILAFSRSGLIDQLEYEGFTNDEAIYAVDNCGADWNEQAAKKAQNYLDIMSFSRSGLIDQLEYEGFTTEQAEYGVTAVGY